ncbi:MAG: purine-nucleoside phosphorylase [Erysipelotrichaceae bacterium]|jgi:purine-nucleoside phosphorylase|nr:purine-nucleoside phosphorylase [Erysipelotrichaceae bacterium]
MGTHHINAESGAFAKTVLMPGDPLRAKWIAETFLKDAKLVTRVRGILGYTGYTKNGTLVSVMASGMGIPSIGIYSYELFTHYGVETIIRIGTAGSYQEHIKCGDLLFAMTASSDSNFANQYKLGINLAPNCDYPLLETAVMAAKNLKVPYHVGNVLSSDVFYDDDHEVWKQYAKLGILGVEMEAYGLYLNALRLKKRAFCILTVSDNFYNDAHLSAAERQNSLVNMVETAILTVEKL